MKRIMNDIGYLNNDKGSFTIEAAIVLPIIIILFLCVFSLMQISHMHSKVQQELTYICDQYSGDSYLLERLSFFDSTQATYEFIGYEGYDYEDIVELKAIGISDLKPSIDFSINEPADLYTIGANVFSYIEETGDTGLNIAATCRKEGIYFLGNQLGKNYFNELLEEAAKRNAFDFEFTIEHLDMCIEEDQGSIIVSYPYKLPINFFGNREITLYNSATLQNFGGSGDYHTLYHEMVEESTYGKSDKSKGEQYQDESVKIVYITPKGKKYHLDPNCFHIRVKPVMVTKESVGDMKPCSKCGHLPAVGGMVYKTENGDVYHTTPTCTAIHHIIIPMTEKEALSLDLEPCGSCYK